MIAKLIAHVIHEVRKEYDRISDDRERAKELVKVGLADLITEISEKKDKEEEDRNPVGFSIPSTNGRDTKTSKN